MAADKAQLAARTALLVAQAQQLALRLQAQLDELRSVTEEMRREHE